MRITWEVQRYARCYTSNADQFSDACGMPLYNLFPAMRQQSTQPQGIRASCGPASWTAISGETGKTIEVEVTVTSQNSAKLSVLCTYADQNILLEQLQFPDVLRSSGLKACPRETGVGFRYKKNGNIQLFQLIFCSSFICRMFYEQLQSLGLLCTAWLSDTEPLIRLTRGMAMVQHQYPNSTTLGTQNMILDSCKDHTADFPVSAPLDLGQSQDGTIGPLTLSGENQNESTTEMHTDGAYKNTFCGNSSGKISGNDGLKIDQTSYIPFANVNAVHLDLIDSENTKNASGLISLSSPCAKTSGHIGIGSQSLVNFPLPLNDAREMKNSVISKVASMERHHEISMDLMETCDSLQQHKITTCPLVQSRASGLYATPNSQTPTKTLDCNTDCIKSLPEFNTTQHPVEITNEGPDYIHPNTYSRDGGLGSALPTTSTQSTCSPESSAENDGQSNLKHNNQRDSMNYGTGPHDQSTEYSARSPDDPSDEALAILTCDSSALISAHSFLSEHSADPRINTTFNRKMCSSKSEIRRTRRLSKKVTLDSRSLDSFANNRLKDMFAKNSTLPNSQSQNDIEWPSSCTIKIEATKESNSCSGDIVRRSSISENHSDSSMHLPSGASFSICNDTWFYEAATLNR